MQADRRGGGAVTEPCDGSNRPGPTQEPARRAGAAFPPRAVALDLDGGRGKRPCLRLARKNEKSAAVLLRAAREAGPDALAGRPPLAQELEAHDVHAFDAGRRSGPGEIERNEREAGLERDLGRAQRVGRVAGADPEEPPQIDVRGARIERIFRIDERAQLSRTGGGGERGAEQRGAARRRRSGDLVQFASAESATESCVERRRAGCEDPPPRRWPFG